MRNPGLFSWVFGALMLGVVTVHADSLTIIVDRSTDNSELYVAGPADTLLALFDVDPSVVPTRDGVVDYDAFSLGTWGIGDALLKHTRVTFNKEQAGFEAMSFMLHPAEDALPMQTPLDANIAIGICSALSSTERYRLNDMTGYVGYFSPQSSAASAIEVVLPAVSQSSLNVTIIDYAQNASSTVVQQFKPGETIRFVISPPARHGALVVSFSLFVLASLLASLWVTIQPHVAEKRLKPLFVKSHRFEDRRASGP